jgi:hypothetical protein
MPLSESFRVTTGSTAGRTHRTAKNLRNNQDAVTAVDFGHLMVGTVSDGCGSQPYSEYGARFIVNTMPKLIKARYRAGQPLDNEWFSALYTALVKRIGIKAKNDFLNPIEGLETHLMATAGGVIVTPSLTYFYGAGDFVIYVNGEVIVWQPEEGNKPLYPALAPGFKGDPRFTFRTHTVPTETLDRFFIGTDGTETLLRVCKDKDEYIPGTDNPVGPIDQIWTTEVFYTGKPHPKAPTSGSDEVGGWLNRLSQDWRMPGAFNHGGLLDDDTTLYAGYRLKENEPA